MTSTQTSCTHERARFHSVQRLGTLPPVKLWHCPACKSTVSAGAIQTAGGRPVAAT